MNRTTWLVVVAAVIVWAASAGVAAGELLYSNDFSTSIDKSWIGSSGSLVLTTSPNGEKFLGTDKDYGLSNDTIYLRLSNLPEHTSLTLSFDLYIIHSWDGNNNEFGPDHWGWAIKGQPTLVDTTFSNVSSFTQSYPGVFYSTNNSGSSSVATSTLGYSGQYGTNTTYHFSYDFSPTDSYVVFIFTAWHLQEISDESWGLDNVRLTSPSTTAVPLPGSLLLLGAGLAGLCALRRWLRE